MGTLNRTLHVLAWEDLASNNNPQRRPVDWRRSLQSIPVNKAQTRPVSIDPSSEVTIFDGTRVLTHDGTTQYTLSLSTLSSTRYRLAWTGVGTAPGFRTDRGLTLSAGSVTITLNANQTVTVTHTGGAVFGAVQVGDTVFIPGTTTGDAALFDALNEGLWTVLAAAAASLTLARPAGAIFSGKTETVAIAANTQFIAYSSTGVQVGDTLDITAGFATSTRRSYRVVAVTSRHVEFTSTLPLAAEATIIPGVNGIKLYSAAVRYVFIETDQELALKFNGASDESVRVEPIVAGDPNQVGIFDKWGTAYSLVIKNRSTTRANLVVITAE